MITLINKLIITTLLLTFTSACTNYDNSIISDFYIYPNPYRISSGDGTFKVTLKKNIDVSFITLTIEIKDQRNQIVWKRTESNLTSTTNVIEKKWPGSNNNGITLTPGVYTAKATISGASNGEKYFELIIQ